MNTKKHTILFISGGSLVGQNILYTLERRRSDLRLVATNSSADSATLRDYDVIYKTPPSEGGSPGYIQLLRDILQAEQPRLVIPCRDEDVYILGRLRQDGISEESTKCLCGDPKIARAMLDKYRSWQFAEENGLPFAATLQLPASMAELGQFAAVHGYPLLVKPVEGFASQGVYFIANDHQLSGIVGNSGVIIQEYLGDGARLLAYLGAIRDQGIPLFYSFEGLKHSIQVYIAESGSVDHVCVTGNTMLMGRSEQVWMMEDEGLQRLGRLCGEVFSRHGWRGPLNVQCERTADGRDVIYEFNGRFTGATHARYLLGYDEVGLAFADVGGIILTPSPPASRDIRKVIRLPRGNTIDIGFNELLERKGKVDQSGVVRA